MTRCRTAEHHGLHAAAHPELVADAPQPAAHRPLRAVESARDAGRGLPAGEQGEQGEVVLAELLGPRRRVSLDRPARPIRACAASQSTRGATRSGRARGSAAPARASRRGPGRSTPRVRAWTSTLPSAEASTGPASTGTPQASAVSWQSRALREPPPTTCTHLDVAPGDRGRLAEVATVGQHEAVEDAAGRPRPGSRAPAPPPRGPGSRPARASCRPELPGGSRRGSLMSTTVRSGSAAGGAGSTPARSAPGTPASAQAPRDSESTQSPITFLRNRMVPSTPPSLVKSAGRAASVSTGSSSSRPTSDQVPEERYADRLAVGGHGDDRRGGVVGPDRDHRHVRRQSELARPTSGSSVPTRSRRDAAAAGSRTGCRPARPGRRPTAREPHVVQPGGGGVGALGADPAGQPVAQQVREQQQRRRPAPARGCRTRRPAGRSC